MGLTESKIIIRKLHNACYEAERQGSCRIDAILRDAEVSARAGEIQTLG